ncbi:MAG: hypothetical protein ACOYIQ_05020 [Christensenellales bacterium]|jgi:hypothetical protein
MFKGQFWTGEGGVPGDFSYGTIHIVSVIVLAALCIVLTAIGLRKDQKGKRRIILAIAALGLGFEIFWRAVWLAQKADLIELYPFYPCNLAGIIIPIIAFTNNRILKELFYFFAFVGGVVTFTIPQGIFTNQYLNFYILKSILQHYAIVLIPFFEFFNKTYQPRFKNFYLTIIGMVIHLFNSEFVPKLAFNKYGTDYIFLRSGLPFVIPGVPGWLTLSVFAIIVVIAAYILMDFKGFLRAIKRKS